MHKQNSACLLIVEDDTIIAMGMAAYLRDCGYDVLGHSASAEEAIKLVAAGRLPDLVLMDIGLASPVDGISAGAFLREQFKVPILYVTGRTDAATVTRAHGVTPAGFLTKPFRPEQLADAVREALLAEAS